MKLFEETKRLTWQLGFATRSQVTLAERKMASHSDDDSSSDAVTLGETVNCYLSGTSPLEDYTSADAVAVGETVTASLELGSGSSDSVRVLETIACYFPALEPAETLYDAVSVGETISTTLEGTVAYREGTEAVTVGETVSADLDIYMERLISDSLTVGDTAFVYTNISLLTRNPYFVEGYTTSYGYLPRFWHGSGISPGSTLFYHASSTEGSACVNTWASDSRVGDYWYQSQPSDQCPFLEDSTAYTLYLSSRGVDIVGIPYLTVTVRDQEGYYLTSTGTWSTSEQAAITRFPIVTEGTVVDSSLNFTSRSSITNSGQGLIKLAVGGMSPTWRITGGFYRVEIVP